MSERPGNALMPNLLTPMDLEPNWEWRDKLPAHGHMSVDFERRIDHDRLRRYRLAREHASLCKTRMLALCSCLMSTIFATSRRPRLGNGNGTRCAGFAC